MGDEWIAIPTDLDGEKVAAYTIAYKEWCASLEQWKEHERNISPSYRTLVYRGEWKAEYAAPNKISGFTSSSSAFK